MFISSRVMYRTVLVSLSVAAQLATLHEASAQVRGGGYLPVEAMNAKLDSLEAVALTCEPSDRHLSIVTGIAVLGWPMSGPDAAPPPPPYPGIVARLAGIYRQCNTNAVRHAIVTSMRAQAERGEAVAFLGEVAQEPAAPGPSPVVANDAALPMSVIAVSSLASLGPEGRQVLQRLHAEGTVRDPVARRYLGKLAAQGFR